MGKGDDIAANIDQIFTVDLTSREGRVVPKSDDVALANGAVKLDATFLYADLADSTTLATKLVTTTAARLLRAYLSSMTTLISYHGGVVRSFDGDRVMGVFIGKSKNTNAAKCALRMNYVVNEFLQPKALAKFGSVQKNDFRLTHCAGVDTGDVTIIRAGVRDSNDLVFVGPAPNFAAKLSDVRDTPYHSYISSEVYGQMHKTLKLSGGKNMWQQVNRNFGGSSKAVYRSNWHWSF